MSFSKTITTNGFREAIAWKVARFLNRGTCVKDNPRSEVFYTIKYGSAKKFANYLRAKRDYRDFKEGVTSFPYTLRVEPVSTCNLKCPLCPTGTGHYERPLNLMSETTYQSLLDELGDYLFFVRLYIWGEPLLNKHLSKLVAITERRGIGTEVSTNLSVPLTDAAIDRLIEAGLSWMIVSIDAASAETYGIYRKGGDFDLVVSNTRRFAARRRALGRTSPYIEWQFIPMRHNEHEMEKFVQLARESGADGVRFKPVRVDKPGRDAVPGDASDVLMAQWKPVKTGVYHAGVSYHEFSCPFLWGHATVHSDGAIASCCETHLPKHDVGHLGKVSFMDQWRGAAFRRLRRASLGNFREPGDDATVCAGCTVFAKPLAKDGQPAKARGSETASATGRPADPVLSVHEGAGE